MKPRARPNSSVCRQCGREITAEGKPGVIHPDPRAVKVSKKFCQVCQEKYLTWRMGS